MSSAWFPDSVEWVPIEMELYAQTQNKQHPYLEKIEFKKSKL